MQLSGIALQGLDQAESSFNRSAARIAQPPQIGQDPGDQVSLSDEAVSLLQAKGSFQANLRVLQTADEMQKQTLDMLA
jgi:flagellar hook-associated protein FlgK